MIFESSGLKARVDQILEQRRLALPQVETAESLSNMRA